MPAKLWWIIHKDLVSEYRARQVWPPMVLLGIVVALVFSFQTDLLPDQKGRLVGSLLWLAVFFAGTLALDRSFASEREEGCWEGLRLYPVTPATIYLAKLTANVVALAALQCLLIPLFLVLSGVPLLAHPGAMCAVALLGNVGIAAVGTLLSALTAATRRSGNLLLVLVLPMVVPVVLAAADATWLITEDNLGPEWWHRVRLLGAFAMIYVTAGTVLFDLVVED